MPVKPAWERSVAFAIHRVKFLPLDEKDVMVTLVQGRSNTRGEPRDWTIHKDTLPRTDPKCGAGFGRRTFLRRRGVDPRVRRDEAAERGILPAHLRRGISTVQAPIRRSGTFPFLQNLHNRPAASWLGSPSRCQRKKRRGRVSSGETLVVRHHRRWALRLESLEGLFRRLFPLRPCRRGWRGGRRRGRGEDLHSCLGRDLRPTRPPCVRTDRRGSFPDDRSPCRRSRGARRRSGCGDFPRRARAGAGAFALHRGGFVKTLLGRVPKLPEAGSVERGERALRPDSQRPWRPGLAAQGSLGSRRPAFRRRTGPPRRAGSDARFPAALCPTGAGILSR